MSTRPSVDALRSWFGRDPHAALPPGLVRLAPRVFLVADEEVAPDARAELTELTRATEGWLSAELERPDIPALWLHVGAACPITPQAHLHSDGLGNVVSFWQPALKPDLVIHELTHALSAIRDQWSAELLAYHAGFTGLGVISTCHTRTLHAYAIDLDDVVRRALGLSRLLAPTEDVIGLRYDPTNPFAGFLFLRVFQELEERAGRKRVFEYVRRADEEATERRKDELFAALFGLSREKLLRELWSKLEAGGPERPAPGPVSVLEGALCELKRRWWMDGFEIAYSGAALTKWSSQSAHGALYVDYRVYRSQRESGRDNPVFRRSLLHRTRDALATSTPSPELAYTRYFLLTDHALSQFRGAMAALPSVDPDLCEALRRCLAELQRFPEDPLAVTAWAHFHLFYPPALGANRAQGVSGLEELVREHPHWDEAYLHLVAYYAASENDDALARWLREYRERADSSHGPSLLERVIRAENKRRMA